VAVFLALTLECSLHRPSWFVYPARSGGPKSVMIVLDNAGPTSFTAPAGLGSYARPALPRRANILPRRFAVLAGGQPFSYAP
jgi:hypothetical protein